VLKIVPWQKSRVFAVKCIIWAEKRAQKSLPYGANINLRELVFFMLQAYENVLKEIELKSRHIEFFQAKLCDKKVLPPIFFLFKKRRFTLL
jgi:hypothetical protein